MKASTSASRRSVAAMVALIACSSCTLLFEPSEPQAETDAAGIVDASVDAPRQSNNDAGIATLEVPLSPGGASDAEEFLATGDVILDDIDLDLGESSDGLTLVGLRFDTLAIPAGATILNAYVQFTADENFTQAAEFDVKMSRESLAPQFLAVQGDLSSRELVPGFVLWPVPSWFEGQAGKAQQTPNLASLLQPLVDMSSWDANFNNVVILISGKGARPAVSVETNIDSPATLTVRYAF